MPRGSLRLLPASYKVTIVRTPGKLDGDLPSPSSRCTPIIARLSIV